jgi:acyl-CoA thioester hydrolase
MTSAYPHVTVMSSDTPDSLAHIRIRRRIEWMDTDAAGIYHWSTVIRLAEAAEAQLHTALGIAAATFGATPRVSAGFDFRRPLRFNDEVIVDLAVEAVGRSSVRYRLILSDGEDRTVAEGQVTTCFIDPSTGRATPWPDALRSALAGGGDRSAGDPS